MIADWASAPVAAARFDLGAITALPQSRPAFVNLSGWRPAAAAALVAGVIAAGSWFGQTGAAPAAAPKIATAAPMNEVLASEGDEAFAAVFTPTASEEDLI
ncbi:hypothetical protein [Sandarakinorhabdus sp.]|uniref:hypothetical protein n=1 Tax=Sandarakinorhabdus sp. TaxID=1916663 RepID=UPI00286D7D59|nr:hypothetical protein [Sandarakinorhabdus sp.]